MAINIIGQKKTPYTIQVFSEEDFKSLQAYHVNELLNLNIKGSRKERAYRELCCYFGSCRYIANMNHNENSNTQHKVDHLTRVQCGFVEDTVYDNVRNRTHWIVKSLSYKNCDQPEAHRFIAAGLEMHCALIGCRSVNDYVALLNIQK